MRSKSAENDNARRRDVERVSTARTYSEAGYELVDGVHRRKKWEGPSHDERQRQLGFAGGGGADAGGPAAPKREAPAAAPAAALCPSIAECCGEEKATAEEGQFICSTLKVGPCRCGSWYCPYCAPRRGGALRHKLRERLRSFAGVFGVTLTIDGAHFSSPEEAWRYVMEGRLLSLFVKELHRREHLYSRDYFWVVEWQRKTEQAHWHLLVNSRYVPYGDIVEVWSKFRPRWAPKLPFKVTADNYRDLDRPAFGSVRYSPPLGDPKTAAAYATKYLIKVPDHGFPDWVMDYEGRIPRFNHSRRFFAGADGAKQESKSSRAEKEPPHGPDCYCPKCRGDEDVPGKRRRERRTPRERLDNCGNKSTVMRKAIFEMPDGRRREQWAKFHSSLRVPFSEVCDVLERTPDEYGEVEVDEKDVARLRQREPLPPGSGGCGANFEEEDW